jgi:hypothetical protein
MTWRAQMVIYRDGVDLVYFQREGETLAVAQPVDLILKEQPRTHVIAGPTLHLPDNSAQDLLQALWDAGLRPNDGAGGSAEAKALRDHIKLAERMADGLLARLPPNG